MLSTVWFRPLTFIISHLTKDEVSSARRQDTSFIIKVSQAAYRLQTLSYMLLLHSGVIIDLALEDFFICLHT